MTNYKKMSDTWWEWRFSDKESINEGSVPKLKVPNDVSYYDREWSNVFREWGDIDFGPRESDMYDWNDSSLYDKVVKEFNAEMGHVAAILNKSTKGLENAQKTWSKILTKYRKKDKS